MREMVEARALSVPVEVGPQVVSKAVQSPNPVLRIPHSALRIPHSALRIRHSALRIATISCLMFVLGVGTAFSAESFNSRLAQGNAKLNKGDVDGAMEIYRELQTEEPESDVLYYSIGCAQYTKGAQEAELKAAADAVASFKAAQEAFQKVVASPDPEIRANAEFNHANCVAEIAMQPASQDKYQESVDAFKTSVAEYESFLREHPGHQGAKNNLDHMRYLLKRMLQNPPPPQQQQQQNGEGEGEGENQQQAQQSKGEGEGEGEDQQQKAEQQGKGEGEGENQQPQQNEKQGEQKEAQAYNAEEAPQEKAGEDASQKQDKQNVDAILQSLEEQDKREQKEMKNQRTQIGLPENREWW